LSLATDQNEVIAFLSRAESFATTEPVVRIDTHAAIVFLARDKAFKMKRAVTYPYLDFSTLERRKAVCEAEFHLNCRTAPDLYLGVMSVNRQDDGTLGFGPGEAVDWLVVMRRFASEDLLLSIAQRGELQTQTVRQLADHIARFHDTAEIRTCPDGAQRVRRIIEGNRESMVALDDGALSGTDCMRLHQASLAALSGVADVLDRRAAEGHVRHCHGDLHLANICLWQGQPVLFDCLEFSEDLATIDVLYDLSFLLMDLWERGYRSAANLAFNRYLDMRDEADGLAAIPLFLSMRAAVRAHVGATAAGLLSDLESRAKKLVEAREYLETALGFLERPSPRLIAVGGLSGSGKSTLSGSLSARIGEAPGARWLRTDVLRKRLAGAEPEAALPPEAYSKERNREVYDTFMDSILRALQAGRTVVADGVFARPDERARVAEVARQAGVDFAGFWLEAPESTMVERVSARVGDASDADADVVRRQLGYSIGELGAWHRIDADGSPEQVLEAALARLS